MAGFDGAIEVLKQRFGENLSTAAAVREQHGHDESYHAVEPPDTLLFAEATGDVVAAVEICARHGMPIIPFRTGTSVVGHVAASHGGLTIDFDRMNLILRVSPDDLDCTVEAGVTRKQLNADLRDT